MEVERCKIGSSSLGPNLINSGPKISNQGRLPGKIMDRSVSSAGKSSVKRHISVVIPEREAVDGVRPKIGRRPGSASTQARVEDDVWIIPMLDAVRETPELWNPGLEAYKMLSVRKAKWNQVANVLNEITELDPPFEGEEIKEKWTNIRDGYVKAKRRRPTGSAATDEVSYRYARYLSFLETVGAHRKTDSNLAHPRLSETVQSQEGAQGDTRLSGGDHDDGSSDLEFDEDRGGSDDLDGGTAPPLFTQRSGPPRSSSAASTSRTSRGAPTRPKASRNDLDAKALQLLDIMVRKHAGQSPNHAYGSLVEQVLNRLKNPASLASARTELQNWINKFDGYDDNTLSGDA